MKGGGRPPHHRAKSTIDLQSTNPYEALAGHETEEEEEEDVRLPPCWRGRRLYRLLKEMKTYHPEEGLPEEGMGPDTLSDSAAHFKKSVLEFLTPKPVQGFWTKFHEI